MGVFLGQVHYSVVHYTGDLKVLFGVLVLEYLVLEVCIDDELEGLEHIVAFLSLLLNRVDQFLFDKNASGFHFNILRDQVEEVDLSALVHAPGHLLLNVDSELQALIHAHLSIVADFGVTAALRATLNFFPGADALFILQLLNQVDQRLGNFGVFLLAAVPSTNALLLCLHDLFNPKVLPLPLLIKGLLVR